MPLEKALRGMLRRKPTSFEMHVQDMVLRITADPDLHEECRATALQFWDQLHSYRARNHEFATSKRPVEVPEDAPALMREIAETAALAGVGPSFTFEGAMTDHVGRFLARQGNDVVVAAGGNYFARPRKRTKLTVFFGEDEERGLAIVIDPKHGPQGIFTSRGKPSLPVASVDGLVVVASSCALADAAGAYALGLLQRPDSLRSALAYLQKVPGVLGGIVVRDDDIGVAGAVEIAA